MNLKRWFSLLLIAALLLTAVPAMAAPSYYITVDLTNQIVTVYRSGNVSNSGIVRQMICSSGKSGSATPTGTFTLPAKSRASERTEWYYFSQYRCYAKYATRIRGGILFHSVTYSTKTSGPSASAVRNLGSPASHGCIRLRVDDAQWIAYNCPAGTKVKIYYSGQRDSALRSRLLKKSFSAADQTYGEFTGASDVLAKGSSGEKVRQLQNRLIELGYLRSAADGQFGTDTHNAVAAFQQAIGVTANGKVDSALWDRLFAADVPAAGLVQGDSGDKVVQLQAALKGLRLYSGEESGNFDEATAAAVREYQSMNGLSVTGSVSDALLAAMQARAAELKNQFGDSDYRLVDSTVSVSRAKVKVSSSLNLRQKASTSSKSLAKMKNGAVVSVLEKGGTWSKIQYGSLVGYAMNSYLSFYTDTTTSKIYEAVTTPTETPAPTETVEPTETPAPTESAEPTETPVPTATPSPAPTAQATTLKWGSTGEGVVNLQRALKTLKLYTGEASGSFDEATVDAVKLFQRVTGQAETGEASPALQTAIFEKAKAVRGEFGDSDYKAVISTVSNTRAKVKVKTSLNLRQKASTSSKSLARMKNGTDLTVLARGAKWSQVQYGSMVGYAQNSYLTFYTQSSTSLSYEAVEAKTLLAMAEEPVETEAPMPVLPPEEPIESVEPTLEPAETAEPTEEPMPVLPPEEPIESAEPTETIEPAETTAPVEPAETAEPAETTAPVEPTETAEPAETPAAAEPTIAPKPLYAVVKTDDAALRTEKDDAKEHIVRPLVRGEFFEVVESDAEWTAVREDDRVYYVRTEEVELTEIRPEVTPQPTEVPVVRATQAPTETPVARATQVPTQAPAAEPAETAAPEEPAAEAENELNEEQTEEKAE